MSLGSVREAAAKVDRLYPLLLPSEGTCTVGGNLSTNAGGTTAVAWGIARQQALGLEVVLADGRVLNNLNKLKKDNTGYDLKNLFIGAEGTLGVITAAGLRLIAAAALGRDRIRRRRLAGRCAGIARDCERAQRRGVTSFELMVRLGIDAVLQARFRRARPARGDSSLVRADRTVLAAARGPARHHGGDPRRGR